MKSRHSTKGPHAASPLDRLQSLISVDGASPEAPLQAIRAQRGSLAGRTLYLRGAPPQQLTKEDWAELEMDLLFAFPEVFGPARACHPTYEAKRICLCYEIASCPWKSKESFETEVPAQEGAPGPGSHAPVASENRACAFYCAGICVPATRQHGELTYDQIATFRGCSYAAIERRIKAGLRGLRSELLEDPQLLAFLADVGLGTVQVSVE